MTPFIPEIEAFEAVFKEGSISGASVVLSVDQGNLSRSIQRLEKNLGIRLFVRHRGGVKATLAAEAVHAALVEMGSIWEHLKKGGYSGRTPRTFRLGMHSSLAHSYLGKIMSYLSAKHPDVYVDVQLGASSEVSQKVQKRELEIGIVVNLIKSKDIVIKNFSTERIVLCGLEAVGPNTVLLRNPQMLFMERVLKGTRFRRVIDVSDYDVAASICRGDRKFCCIIPEPVRDRYSDLKTISEVKSAIPVKLITYPGSAAVGLLNELARACRAATE